jgi:hypothetical protein
VLADGKVVGRILEEARISDRRLRIWQPNV